MESSWLLGSGHVSYASLTLWRPSRFRPVIPIPSYPEPNQTKSRSRPSDTARRTSRARCPGRPFRRARAPCCPPYFGTSITPSPAVERTLLDSALVRPAPCLPSFPFFSFVRSPGREGPRAPLGAAQQREARGPLRGQPPGPAGAPSLCLVSFLPRGPAALKMTRRLTGKERLSPFARISRSSATTRPSPPSPRHLTSRCSHPTLGTRASSPAVPRGRSVPEQKDGPFFFFFFFFFS